MVLDAAVILKSWAHTSLEAVCQILDSKRIPLNNSERTRRIAGRSDDDLYPYYGATGQVGVIDDFIFEGEHILLGEDGAPFLDPFKVKSYLVGGNFWVNNHAHILNSFISSRYLCYYLNQIDYSNHVTGTTRLKLTQNALKRIPVLIAPAAEQHRIVAKIAELFSELDKGIESLKTAREQLKVYRQAVLKHAFEGKLTAQWREENKDKLETPEQLLACIKQEREAQYERQLEEWKAAVKIWEEIGKSGKKPLKPKKLLELADVPYDVIAKLPKLPEGWLWFRVADLCEVVRGGSPRPAGDLRYYDGTIPFLKVADLTRTAGVYLDTHSFTIKEAGLHKTRLVAPPILMLSNSGATLGVPKVCRIRTTFNDGIAAFLGIGRGDLLYHYYFWASKTFELRAINQGAAQPNLNTNLIKETFIPMSSHDEMQIVSREIERALYMCEQLVVDIEIQLKKSFALRQSILKKAFTGQLVPQDPNDEPASALLRRIKADKAVHSDNAITPGRRTRAKATG